jgi:curli biogenesis system outer membrane secretion channel CsgG
MAALIKEAILVCVFLFPLSLLAQQASNASASELNRPTPGPTPTASNPKAPAPADLPDLDGKLLQVKRIFVESFGDDSISKQVQAMVVSSLTESKRFIVTENKDKADAILKGSSLEKTSQELHSSSEATAAGGAAGGHSGSVSGSFVNGTGTVSGSSSGGFASRSMAIEDSSTSTETINDARIAVRLVDSDGDVIWATTQESKGAKYKGASADIADKVVKQLLRDREKIQKRSSTPTAQQ